MKENSKAPESTAKPSGSLSSSPAKKTSGEVKQSPDPGPIPLVMDNFMKNANSPATVSKSELSQESSDSAAATSAATGQSQPKLSHHGKALAKACAQLTPEHLVILEKFLPSAIRRARRTGKPEAEIATTAAVVRAIIGFGKPRKNSLKPFKPVSIEKWIDINVSYSLRNPDGKYLASSVRDAFIAHRDRFGFEPSLAELCKFAEFSESRVLKVWAQVATELKLTLSTDPILQSVIREVAIGAEPTATPDTIQLKRVRQVLAAMRPADACLLMLSRVCGYNGEDIVSYLKRARRVHARYGNVDAMERLLDVFANTKATRLVPPWDNRLLKIVSNGAIRTRLFRAEVKFMKIWRALFGVRIR